MRGVIQYMQIKLDLNNNLDSKLKKKLEDYKAFEKFKENAIDFENGKNFHLNIKTKGTQVFYNGYNFIAFKIMKVDDVWTAYIYYMFGQSLPEFKSCFYAFLNFCLGNKVKFIYYSEKQKGNNFYLKFLREFGFKTEFVDKKYVYHFECAQCHTGSENCQCKTVAAFI